MDSSSAEIILTGLLFLAMIALLLGITFGTRAIRKTRKDLQTPVSELSDSISKESAKHPVISTVMIFVFFLGYAFLKVFGKNGFSVLHNTSKDPISSLNLLFASVAILFVGAGAFATAVSLTRNQSAFSAQIWDFIQGRGRIWIMPALFGLAVLSVIIYVTWQYRLISP